MINTHTEAGKIKMQGDGYGPDWQTDPPDNGNSVDRADQGNAGVQANITITDCTFTGVDPGDPAGDFTGVTFHHPSLPPLPPFTMTMPVARTYLSPLSPLTAISMVMSGNTVMPGYYCVEPAPPNEGIVAGEIIAWRCWSLHFSAGIGLVLRSVFMHQNWLPQTTMTGDVEKEEGVHAFKTREQVDIYAAANIFCGVKGRVKLWGDVVEHECGYRASNAKIVALDEFIDPRNNWLSRRRQLKTLAALRQKYGPLEGCKPFVLP